MRPFSSRNGFEIGFWQGAGDHSMHVKLAYAVSVAAPVAMLAGCSKKSDDGAGRDAAVIAASSASGVRVAGAGRAAPSVRRIAQLGRDKENGAGLTIEDINALGLTTGRAAGHADCVAASRRSTDAGRSRRCRQRAEATVPPSIRFDETARRRDRPCRDAQSGSYDGFRCSPDESRARLPQRPAGRRGAESDPSGRAACAAPDGPRHGCRETGRRPSRHAAPRLQGGHEHRPRCRDDLATGLMTAPEQCGAVFVSAPAAGPAVQAGRRAPGRSTLTGID